MSRRKKASHLANNYPTVLLSQSQVSGKLDRIVSTCLSGPDPEAEAELIPEPEIAPGKVWGTKWPGTGNISTISGNLIGGSLKKQICLSSKWYNVYLTHFKQEQCVWKHQVSCLDMLKWRYAELHWSKSVSVIRGNYGNVFNFTFIIMGSRKKWA